MKDAGEVAKKLADVTALKAVIDRMTDRMQTATAEAKSVA